MRMMTVYELEKPIGTPKTHKRSRANLDEALRQVILPPNARGQMRYWGIGPATRPAYGGLMGTRPRLGLKPTTPHQPAGRRMEPPMSVPMCSGP